MTKARGILRTYPAGAAAASKAISIKREVDDVEIATDTTDADGVWDYAQNGNAGPWYWSGTDTTPDPDAVRVGSTQAYGGGGAFSLYELVYALRVLCGGTLGGGVIDGYLNELAITDPDSGTNLAYATGGVVVNGIPAIWSSSGTHAVVTAQDVTNPKACYLVVEVTGAGQTEEGKAVLKDVCGAAAASPSLPSLTQTEATYQYPLATFRLGIVGASNANDVTTLVDARTFLGTHNPVVSSVVRRTDPSSIVLTTSTTGTDLTGLTTTVTLLNGIAYDLMAQTVVLIKATAGQTVSIAPYLNSVSNIATYVAANNTDYLAIGNAYTLDGQVGAGTTIDCGVRWKVSGGTGTALTGFLLVMATPRT